MPTSSSSSAAAAGKAEEEAGEEEATAAEETENERREGGEEDREGDSGEAKGSGEGWSVANKVGSISSKERRERGSCSRGAGETT